MPAHRFDDRARVDALVYVQRNRRHFERSPLRFPGSNQLRIEMRIVGAGLLAGFPIRRWRHQPHRRIVNPLLPLVIVLLDGLFLRVARRLLHLCHLNPLELHDVMTSLHDQRCPNWP